MRRIVPHLLVATLTVLAGVAAIGSQASRHPLVTFSAKARVCHSDNQRVVKLQTTELVRKEIHRGTIGVTVLLPSMAIIFERPGIDTCGRDDAPANVLELGEGTSLVIGAPHLSTFLRITQNQAAVDEGSLIFNDAFQLVPFNVEFYGAHAYPLTEQGIAYYSHKDGHLGQEAAYFRVQHGEPQYFFASCLPNGNSQSEAQLCHDLAVSIVATNLLNFKMHP